MCTTSGFMIVAQASGSACLQALGWSGVGAIIAHKRWKAANRKASLIVSLATAHTNPSRSVSGTIRPSAGFAWVVCKGDSNVCDIVSHSLAWPDTGACAPSSVQTQNVNKAQRYGAVLSVLLTQWQRLLTDSSFSMYTLLGVNAGLLTRNFCFYPLKPREYILFAMAGRQPAKWEIHIVSCL